MASKWHVTLKNDNFDIILSENRSLAGKVIRKVGNDGIRYIKEAILETRSVDTGNMLNSVQEAPIAAAGGGRMHLVFAIDIGAEYWRFVNDGTVHIGPRYFLEAGVNRMQVEFLEAMEQFGRRRK